MSEPKKSLIEAFNSPAKELLAKGGSMVCSPIQPRPVD